MRFVSLPGRFFGWCAVSAMLVDSASLAAPSAASFTKTRLQQEPTVSRSRRPPEEMRFNFYGVGTAQVLFWRIDSSGKGEISIQYGGYKPLLPHAAAPIYHIASGAHQFDIGSDGYSELRAHLARVIDSNLALTIAADPNAWMLDKTDRRCASYSSSTRSLEIIWSSESNGQFSLPSDCLNAMGAYSKSMLLQSWHIIANRMHINGHPAVTIVKQPEISAPRDLRLSMLPAWLRYPKPKIRWRIDANGKGWIDLCCDQYLPEPPRSIPLFDEFTPHLARAGRYHFQLDIAFHQAVLRALDPYLNGPLRNTECNDRPPDTNEPTFKIYWTDQQRRAQKHEHLACSAFDARAHQVNVLFGKLLKNGKLGKAVLLNKRQ
jgi:hypothetical protein